MKAYKSHKVVQAAKILELSVHGDGGVLRLDDGVNQHVSLDWLTKHVPEEGGYFVRYPDGYESYSPAEPFESGYTAEDEGGGFKAPPVKGYNDQPGYKLTMVNQIKEAEERVLRLLDTFAQNSEAGQIDGRWYAIGRTHLEQGFMATCRAIFQPGRASLPEDVAPGAAES